MYNRGAEKNYRITLKRNIDMASTYHEHVSVCKAENIITKAFTFDYSDNNLPVSKKV